MAADYRKWLEQKPRHLTSLLCAADLHWRKQELTEALDLAQRAVSLKPKNYQALMITASSYAHLGQWDDAYFYAKRSLKARRPNWILVKWLLAPLALFGRAPRRNFARLSRACDIECAADLKHLSWARELVAVYEP
jgi:tetratricopeptide (TPR) repeat protein